MTQRILITPEEVRAVAGQFRQASEQSNDMVNRLNATISEMEPRWDGLSKQKFYGEFQQWRQQMTHFVTLLNEINMQLNTVADRFEQADRPV